MTHQDGANFLALAGKVVRVDFAQRRHGAGAGTLPGGVLAGGDLAQGLMGGAPGLLGGHPPVAADDEAAVGGLASTPARTVVDDVGAHPGGPHADNRTTFLREPSCGLSDGPCRAPARPLSSSHD